jgi:hypothetical protein
MELGPPPDFSPVSNRWALKCEILLPNVVKSCGIMDDAITSAIIKARHSAQQMDMGRRAEDQKATELQPPTCVRCKTPMNLAGIEPHPRFASVDECTYSCQVCDRLTRRLVARKAQTRNR